MNSAISVQIEIGRRVNYPGNMASAASDGLIVATYPHHFDAILFDGRKILRVPNCAFSGARPWILMHRVHGPRLVEVMQQKAAEITAAAALAKATAAQQLADEVETLVKQNPTLQKIEKYAAGAVVAKNIRAALKAAGVKGARVMTERGSMVSSIRVVLPAALSDEQAEAATALCKRFVLGQFNGWDDSYEYRTSAWTEAFGGVRYVFVGQGA
uniref:hypothetical protein n=1 Tax=Xanthomonas sp. 0924 TaxID=2835534 RepID=UPI003F7D23D5